MSDRDEIVYGHCMLAHLRAYYLIGGNFVTMRGEDQGQGVLS